MRFLFRSFLVVFLLVVVVAGASFFLPREYEVERAKVMQAPPDEVHPWVDDIRRWEEWMVWADEPGLELEFSGPARGEGAVMSWESPEQGSGTMTITRSTPGKGVWFDLVMELGLYGAEDGFHSKGSITYRPGDDGTEVKWSHWSEYDQPLPVYRYMGLFADRMLGPDFEANLDNLERKVTPGSGP